jgi:TPR repeat protein
VPPSKADAARWLHRAAAAGHAPAQYAYARFLWSGHAPAESQGLFTAQRSGRDSAAAAAWAEAAAAAGLPEAQALLGQILCFGPGAMRDETRGETLFAQAAAAGRPEGHLGLALLLNRRAADAPALAEQARHRFALAAEGGSPYALFALGVMAERAAVTDAAAWREAAQFYAEAARRGHRGAQARWGMLLVEGLGGTRNPVEGESWVRRAALAGETDAAAWLGDHYARPQGDLPPNPMEAVAWYRRAADLGHGGAARRLGAMYRDGRAGTDMREAASLFQQAARLGEMAALADLQALIAAGALPPAAMTETIETLPAGQYWYGRLLLRQATTPAEEAEARRWIARAADTGMIAAEAVLAEMLLHGRGGPRDVPAARRLFETAAAGGHLGAIFALGVLHAGAEGVPRDLARSEALLREAAAGGHAPAQAALAKFTTAGLYCSSQACSRIDENS